MQAVDRMGIVPWTRFTHIAAQHIDLAGTCWRVITCLDINTAKPSELAPALTSSSLVGRRLKGWTAQQRCRAVIDIMTLPILTY